MKLLRILTISLAVIPTAILLLICVYFLEQMLGYYPGRTGLEVANIAYSGNKTVEECRKILAVPWPHMGPTASEQRSLCIFEYAGLKKDPSVCEQLMPSEYGMSCVGHAEGPQECNFMPDRKVLWSKGEVTLYECIHSPPDDSNGNSCCAIAEVTNIIGKDDCSKVSGSGTMLDLCYSQLALKKEDTSICEKISNPRSRASCRLTTKYKSALTEYPRPINLSEVPAD